MVDDASRDPELSRYLRELAGGGRDQRCSSSPSARASPPPSIAALALHARSRRGHPAQRRRGRQRLARPPRLARAARAGRRRGGAVLQQRRRRRLSRGCMRPTRCRMPPGSPRFDRLFARANRAAERGGAVRRAAPACTCGATASSRSAPSTARRSRSDWGVEIDFCLRAASVGFHHFLAGDVYVGHAGGASFGARGRRAGGAQRRGARPRSIPAIPARARRCARAPRGARSRAASTSLRLAEWPVPLVVFVAHGWGGGIRRHMTDLAAFARGPLRGAASSSRPPAIR